MKRKKKYTDALRRIVSYRNLQAFTDCVGDSASDFLDNVINADWGEATAVCIVGASADKVRTALLLAAEYNAAESFAAIVDYARVRGMLGTAIGINKAFVHAVSWLGYRVVTYCLDNNLATADPWKLLRVFALGDSLVGYDAIFPRCIGAGGLQQNLPAMFLLGCERHSLGVVKRVLACAREHKLVIPPDAIIDGLTTAFGKGVRDNVAFADGILKQPELQAAIRTQKGSVSLDAAIKADDTLGIKRLLDAGVTPGVKTITLLAEQFYEAAKLVDGWTYKSEDKMAYDKFRYRLGIIIAKSGQAWRWATTRAAIRGLIKFWGVDSPNGQDLTATLFLMIGEPE